MEYMENYTLRIRPLLDVTEVSIMIVIMVMMVTLLLGGELLAERCRTDDLMPGISLLCLPPCRVDPEIL